MSELELSMFRQRSQEALKQKASRGALVLGVAAGYVKIARDRIESMLLTGGCGYEEYDS